VFAAKVSKHEKGKRIFTDIGLKGISRKELQGSIATFTGLKFITTSFHHEVLKGSKNRIINFSYWFALLSTLKIQRSIY